MPFVYHGLRLDVAYASAFWAETLIYGIYTCLFIAAMPSMVRRLKRNGTQSSGWVFMFATSFMYLISSCHMALAGYRFFQGVVLRVDPLGPVNYYQDQTRWEFLADVTLLCFMTWAGDALVIYRCWFVWNGNYWMIALPVGLLLGSIGANAFTLYWLRHPLAVNLQVGLGVLNSIYPLNFIQNLMTTSLITLKIWIQHRASSVSGVLYGGPSLSLIHVVRIIIESAMIYTLQLLVIIVLFFRRDNFQYVIQAAIIPTIGITFFLIALRVRSSKRKDTNFLDDLGTDTLPHSRWLEDTSSRIEFTHPEFPVPAVTTMNLTLRRPSKAYNSPDEESIIEWAEGGGGAGAGAGADRDADKGVPERHQQKAIPLIVMDKGEVS